MSEVARLVQIQIALTEPEAEVLCALIGGIANLPRSLEELYAQLDASLPNREVSFSDLFHGEVTAV